MLFDCKNCWIFLLIIGDIWLFSIVMCDGKIFNVIILWFCVIRSLFDKFI